MDETMFSGVVTEIYKQSVNLIGQAYDEIAPRIKNACHRYSENYKNRHGQLKVFCVGMRKPIPLDEVYVTVQFLDEERKSRYQSLEDVERKFRTRHGDIVQSLRGKRQDGIQIANNEQFLMLLGGPGVGKSTFLRKVGLEALKGKDGNFAHKSIPVFLELKRFTEDSIDIQALITEEFKICGYPCPETMTEAALKSGKLLILFDGLDEVPDANHNNVIRKIGDFVDQHSQNQFIASCRKAAYTGGFIRFIEVEIADFDDSQIETYINKWFSSAPDWYRLQLDEEMKTAEQCWQTLNAPGHQATKELARNPLLLTLLCMVYDNSQNFPRNRADLYEKALNIFLEEWAAEKRISPVPSVSEYLDIADEKRLLSEIAARNFNENQLFFSKNRLIDQIHEFGQGNANTPPTFNARKILDTILVDQGIFVEQVNGVYSFSHLTFHEYLTANYIVKNKQSIKRLVKQYLHNQQWREVFLLTAGLMHKADDLLEHMTDAVVKSINTPILKMLFQWVKRITNTSGDQYIGIIKREFVMDQYICLWLMNKIHKAIKSTFNQYRKFPSELSIDQYLEHHSEFSIDQLLSQERSLFLSVSNALLIYTDFKSYSYLDLYPNLDVEDYLEDPSLDLRSYPHLYLYLHQSIDRDVNFSLHRDLYQYADANFYTLLSSELHEMFNSGLDERITIVERMEKEKIYKEVDLQQVIQRFKAQRKFIKAVKKGKPINPLEDTIYDIWLSVLHITDDMLGISREEVQSIVQYFRALQLILDCKSAAGRVSPEVWQKIEDRLLAWDVEEIEN